MDLDAFLRRFGSREGGLGSEGGGVGIGDFRQVAPTAELDLTSAIADIVHYTPQMDPALAACNSNGAPASSGGGSGNSVALPLPLPHVLFSGDTANIWGGPTDMLNWGAWDTMELFMLRARAFDTLVMDYNQPLHPEQMVKCAVLELAREATRAGNPLFIHTLMHVPLKVGWCRRWAEATTMCTGRLDCYSINNVTAFGGIGQKAGTMTAAQCEPITYLPFPWPPRPA